MLSLPDAIRIFVAREPVDFRKAHDGLCQVVRDVFGDDPTVNLLQENVAKLLGKAKPRQATSGLYVVEIGEKG